MVFSTTGMERDRGSMVPAEILGIPFFKACRLLAWLVQSNCTRWVLLP